jgi:hypothetical protein
VAAVSFLYGVLLLVSSSVLFLKIKLTERLLQYFCCMLCVVFNCFLSVVKRIWETIVFPINSAGVINELPSDRGCTR